VTGDDTIVLAWLLLTVLFLGFVIVSLLGVVFRTRRVVTDTVLGQSASIFSSATPGARFRDHRVEETGLVRRPRRGRRARKGFTR